MQGDHEWIGTVTLEARYESKTLEEVSAELECIERLRLALARQEAEFYAKYGTGLNSVTRKESV